MPPAGHIEVAALPSLWRPRGHHYASAMSAPPAHTGTRPAGALSGLPVMLTFRTGLDDLVVRRRRLIGPAARIPWRRDEAGIPRPQRGPFEPQPAEPPAGQVSQHVCGLTNSTNTLLSSSDWIEFTGLLAAFVQTMRPDRPR